MKSFLYHSQAQWLACSMNHHHSAVTWERPWSTGAYGRALQLEQQSSQAPGLVLQLLHDPIWILRAVKQNFLQMAREEIWKIFCWCWQGLFYPTFYFSLGSLSTFTPHHIPAVRAMKGEMSSCKRSHTCASRSTVLMYQKLNRPKKYTSIGTTSIKKKKGLKCAEQCDQLPFSFSFFFPCGFVLVLHL